MKTIGIIGLFALVTGAFACAASGENTDEATGAATAATAEVVVCDAGDTAIATVKTGIVTVTKTGKLYALASGKATALTLSADRKSGKWSSKTVSCKTASAADAPGWIAAGLMASYGDDISGLAQSINDDSNSRNKDPKSVNTTAGGPTNYVVYAIETSKRDSLDLGTKVDKSQGALPGSDETTDTLYDDDNGYGGLSAAYDLGGGDDWGEYFQGVSDGVSLGDSLGDTKAGFIAHEKTKAFDGVLNSKGASAVEVTVGQWTFFAPSDFSK